MTSMVYAENSMDNNGVKNERRNSNPCRDDPFSR